MRRSDGLPRSCVATGVALSVLLLVSCAGQRRRRSRHRRQPRQRGRQPATGGATGPGGLPATGGATGSGGTVGTGGNGTGGSRNGRDSDGRLVRDVARRRWRGRARAAAAARVWADVAAGAVLRPAAARLVPAPAGPPGPRAPEAPPARAVGGAGTIVWPKKFLGNITQRGQIPSNFTTYWDQIVPENEGKWGSVEGTQGKYNWTALDNIHSFAKQHNIPFKQHNFVWGAQQPSWIGGLSQANQKAAVEDWIKQFCTRYPDTQMIDVLNEPPPHTTPPYMAALGGAGTTGYDWVVTIFKWARQYCPTSILIVNDYNIIEQSGDNNNMIKLVTSAMKGGAPIDAIGAQAHGLTNASASTTQMYIDKLTSSTGLPVLISEFDLNIADDTQQKNQMQSLFTMFWNDKNVKGVTYWGYIQGETWETNTWLLSTGGTERSAMSWLMQFVGR